MMLTENVYRHDLTDTTREMAKRGTDDLKKLALLQSDLVSVHDLWLPYLSSPSYSSPCAAAPEDIIAKDLPRLSALACRVPARAAGQRGASAHRGRGR